MQNVLIVIHVIISLILIAVVLLQHGKQQGLSGAIAGGAETFFGKNKGRTVDAMLKKFTSVIAALFIISSVALAFVSVSEYKSKSDDSAKTQTQENSDGAQSNASLDENGNLVDEKGNVIMTAEQMQKQLESSESEDNKTENENADTEKSDAKDSNAGK